MSRLPQRFPPALARLVARLPQTPPALALSMALNLALDRMLPRAALQALEGRCVRLQVNDLGVQIAVRYVEGRFHAVGGSGAADVCISADASAFALLALRREDPDTMVFKRKLVVEGDTDAGLALKNALDAVEWPQFVKTLTDSGIGKFFQRT